MVRKIYFYSLICFLFIFANKTYATPIDDVINSNNSFSQAIVAISVKDLNTGNTVYQKNSKALVHPASTLKIITSSAALNYLGTNYKFKTLMTKNEGNTYIKVGADPIFTSNDLKNLVQQYKEKNPESVNTIIIDDLIIDKIPFGIGWQWDDNINGLSPLMSPYITNHNTMQVKISADNQNHICIESPIDYTEKIENRLRYGETTNISVYRNIFADKSPIFLNGIVNTPKTINIPVKYPESMYKFILSQALKNNNTQYGKFPQNVIAQAEITHSIVEVLKRVNSNSDNLAAEVLLKHVGAKKSGTTGTTQSGLGVVKNFYINNGLNMNNIAIVDGSGLSMNDYVTPDFMTSALITISKNANFQIIKNSMSDPNNGSFRGRLPELNGKIKVKTGTLANTSAVIGYVQTSDNRNLVFAIMIDNIPNNATAKVKVFENQIIKAIAE